MYFCDEFFFLGNEKHSLQVASQEENSQPTVRDMALLIEQVTGVPVSFQKLIYKGKYIFSFCNIMPCMLTHK